MKINIVLIKFRLKVKAGALQFAIFISILIALLISAFISMVYLQSHFQLKAIFYKKAVHFTNLGIAYSFEHKIDYDQMTYLEFDESLNDLTTLTKEHWGIFDLIRVNSAVKDESFQKTALLGGYNSLRNALYLQDDNRPLIVAGNTIIKGNTALPIAGVKRGAIAGHSYTGAQLIYGNIKNSNSGLPILMNRDFVKKFAKSVMIPDNTEFLELIEDQTVINSFEKPTIIYKNNSVVDLQFSKYIGNIIIQSDTLIRVARSTTLKNVILIAPIIEISDKVKGSFQMIASHNISIGNQCELDYPSALILVEEIDDIPVRNSQQGENQIVINSNSVLKGLVCFISDRVSHRNQAQIVIEDHSTVVGEVYCEQNLEIKGRVEGMVYTRGFTARQFGSVYQNHIFNGEIIGDILPKQYSGLQFENSPLSVVEWLN